MRRPTVLLTFVIVPACAGGEATTTPTTTDTVVTSVAAQLTTMTLGTTTTGVPESTTTTNAQIVGGVTTRHDSACTYEGPTAFDLNSDVTFTFINASETVDVGFSVWKVDEGTTIEDIFHNGISEVTDQEQGLYQPVLLTPRALGGEWSLTVTLDKVGLHALNCFQHIHALNCFQHIAVSPDYASTLFTVRG